ncbi:HlyD family secretion protein [uncultured Marinobacter sp.]|uniref:HlyD family secretion protein n=1 Tax=uncultured Marinobacter sp. TaxID=187379 RepID=UPI00262B1912|nr:HlyD family secretion protein [uncultured Marinobacter sp.]
MDLLLVLTYTALCIAIFKIFRIPLNKWTVPTAVLGGVVLIGGLIFSMNYNHPFSEASRDYFVTTPIVPTVSGRVVEVKVQGGVKVKKDDVLFVIDPEPFQFKVDSIRAQLKSAKIDQKRALELVRRGAGSQRAADLSTAQADTLQAQLAEAEFNLSETVVRAPTDGYVAQLALRPGMMAVSLPLRPVMVFVHAEDLYFVGWYRQNSLLRLQAGNEAEVALNGLPGQVFSGRVKSVLPALAEGQVQASGNLINPLAAVHPGRIPVLIEITDPDFQQYVGTVPGGAFGQSAIYSEHFHHVAIMRKILLRMSSWVNYLFPFH